MDRFGFTKNVGTSSGSSSGKVSKAWRSSLGRGVGMDDKDFWGPEIQPILRVQIGCSLEDAGMNLCKFLMDDTLDDTETC